MDDPGHEPVNPFRFDFDIPLLRHVQVRDILVQRSHLDTQQCAEMSF